LKRVSGQALNNGVMMISDRTVILVRKDDGSIIEKVKEFSFSNNKIPVLRGIIQLFKQSKNGFNAIYFSTKHSKDKISMIMLVFLVAIYYFYPYFINIKKLGISENYFDLAVLFFLILFMLLNKSVKNTLKYHGAEHKVVNCYEDDCELTIENVKKYPKEHIRCGTSLMVVIIILCIIFELIISFLPKSVETIGYIMLLPLVIGISYEFMLIALKSQNRRFYSLFVNIGLKAQKITTREPDEDQIEVAIKALQMSIN